MSRHRPAKSIHLPQGWTDQQLLAVFEFVDLVRDQLWHQHGTRIQAALRRDRRTTPASPTPLDDPPF